ncbi:MAG: hypothetical protein M3301_04140, partial [Chloroflexota bacterium]|nr:hypothetical protein [Chloroflexota bacterium]
AGGPIKVRIANTNDFEVSGEVSGQTTKKVSVSRKRRIKLSAKAFSVPGHAQRTISLKLPTALGRLLRRKHNLSLRLTAKVRDPAGHSRTVNKTVSPKLLEKRRRRR